MVYLEIPPKTYFSTMCETEAVCWSFNKVGRQADTLTYCGVRPDSIEAKSNQIWFIRDKSNPIGFRVHTDYGHTKANSLQTKFKSQSQINIWNVDIKA